MAHAQRHTSWEIVLIRYGVPSVTSRTKGISAVVGFWVPFFGLFFREKLGVRWAICGDDHVVITSALASANYIIAANCTYIED